MKLRLKSKAAENWRYVLAEDEAQYIGSIPGVDCTDFENEWIRYSAGWLLVKKPYGWDGCSGRLGPLEVSDGPLGPDGHPLMWRASLVHDPLYQFGEQMAKQWGIRWDSRLPWQVSFRPWADRVFLRFGRASGYEYADTYYWMVRWLGGFYHAVNSLERSMRAGEAK